MKGTPEERRAAHAAYMRAWTARHPGYGLEYKRAWLAKNTEAHAAANRAWRRRTGANKAHMAVRYAIRCGRLIRPEACARCGKKCQPEASHDDYSKPLEVEWLCRRCHADKDLRIR